MGGSAQPCVFVAVPTYGTNVTGLTSALLNAGSGFTAIPGLRCSSNLAHCFNVLLCEAINMQRKGHRITDFVMCHSDVIPEWGFIQKLLKLRRQEQADVLSVVLRIKNDTGITSTALLDKKTGEMRRLTQKEAWAVKKPAFDAEDAGFPGRTLLINTGLWIGDFSLPWYEWVRDRKVFFNISNEINVEPNGDLRADTFTEDWRFGLQLSKLPVTVKVTTAVSADHQGPTDYSNQGPLGEWDTDRTPDLYYDPADADEEDEEITVADVQMAQ